MTLLTLPRASIPVIDSKGYMSREWYRWATDATSRMGGVEGAGTDDLTLSQFEDAGAKSHSVGMANQIHRLSHAVWRHQHRHILTDRNQSVTDAVPGDFTRAVDPAADNFGFGAVYR